MSHALVTCARAQAISALLEARRLGRPLTHFIYRQAGHGRVLRFSWGYGW